LRALGIPAEKLRLVYVRARIGGPQSNLTQAHMVLAYYITPDAEPQVLDNLITDIRVASRRSDLTPIFSFNTEGIWAGADSSRTSSSDATRLSRWRDLLARAKAEGFE
jgi:predicted transglutaminase-like cysteine proteinase